MLLACCGPASARSPDQRAVETQCTAMGGALSQRLYRLRPLLDEGLELSPVIQAMYLNRGSGSLQVNLWKPPFGRFSGSLSPRAPRPLGQAMGHSRGWATRTRGSPQSGPPPCGGARRYFRWKSGRGQVDAGSFRPRTSTFGRNAAKTPGPRLGRRDWSPLLARRLAWRDPQTALPPPGRPPGRFLPSGCGSSRR